MIHILVVDDDKDLCRTVCTYLNDCGFETKSVQSAQDAYEEMQAAMYDLVISDIMMPGTDGFAFAEAIRQVNRHIPILFVSARDDLPAKQKGFRIGIDDYMVKPIELVELEMRVRALLRRANIETEHRLEIGNLFMDADAMSAVVDGEEIAVTTREFNILYKLLSYPNKTFSRAQLLDEFWGVETDTGLRAVDVYVTKLRDKFSDCGFFQDPFTPGWLTECPKTLPYGILSSLRSGTEIRVSVWSVYLREILRDRWESWKREKLISSPGMPLLRDLVNQKRLPICSLRLLMRGTGI